MVRMFALQVIRSTGIEQQPPMLLQKPDANSSTSWSWGTGAGSSSPAHAHTRTTIAEQNPRQLTRMTAL
jgi:hypothetical protein